MVGYAGRGKVPPFFATTTSIARGSCSASTGTRRSAASSIDDRVPVLQFRSTCEAPVRSAPCSYHSRSTSSFASSNRCTAPVGIPVEPRMRIKVLPQRRVRPRDRPAQRIFCHLIQQLVLPPLLLCCHTRTFLQSVVHGPFCTSSSSRTMRQTISSQRDKERLRGDEPELQVRFAETDTTPGTCRASAHRLFVCHKRAAFVPFGIPVRHTVVLPPEPVCQSPCVERRIGHQLRSQMMHGGYRSVRRSMTGSASSIILWTYTPDRLSALCCVSHRRASDRASASAIPW